MSHRRNDSLLVQTLEQASPHDHLCLIYETPEEQLAAAVSFIRIGLDRGERCIYILDESTPDAVLGAMRREGIDVDAAIQSGALILSSKEESYLKKGYFDPDEMIAFLEEAIREAEKAGFSALRATGEMTWALGGEAGTERLIEYEAKLNRFFPKNNLVGICQYNRKRFRPELLIDVIRTHPKVISGGLVCQNLHYVPPAESSGESGPSQQVERLLADIVDREKREIALQESNAALASKSLLLERETAEHRRADEQLDLYRRIVASANDAIGIIDPTGIYLQQNGSHRRLIGYSDEALQGKTPAIHLGGEVFGRIAEELAKNGSYRGEHISRTRSGEEVDIELSAFTMRNAAGEIVCHVGIKRDVTRRKKVEKALRLSEERYERAAVAGQVGVWDWDIATNALYLSPNLKALLGYADRELANDLDAWCRLVHPDDKERVIAATQAHLQNVTPVYEVEVRRRHRDGSYRWFLARGTALRRADGTPYRLTGSDTDITERKQSEAALQRAHMELAIKMEQLQRQLGISHLLHQLSGRFTLGERGDLFLSEVVKRVAELTKATRCGISLVDPDQKMIRPHTFYGFNEKTIQGIELPVVVDETDPVYRLLYRGETLMLHPILSAPGMERYRPLVKRLGIESILAIPLQVRGVPLGALYICDKERQRPFTLEDTQLMQTIANQLALAIANQQYAANLEKVNEELQRKKIEAEEASRLKSQFLSTVSHELRTPLNAIFGYTHLLMNEAYGTVEEAQRLPLDGIRRNAADLSRLINDVLDLTRIEAGKMSLRLSEIDLGLLIEEAVVGIRPLSDKKALPVRCIVDPALPRMESDAGKIKQILVNLLSNAVKFTSKGEITVCARSWSDPEGVALVVTDTGIGIRPEDLPRIFDAFHQLDGADTREFGGVGLGLTIVKELLQFLEGEIRVESEYGKGSTFTVLLPLQIGAKNRRAEGEENA